MDTRRGHSSRKSSGSSLGNAIPFATLTILAINLVVMFLMPMSGIDEVYRFAGLKSWREGGGNVVALVIFNFFQVGRPFFAVNLIALAICGAIIETCAGRVAVLCIFAASGLISGLVPYVALTFFQKDLGLYLGAAGANLALMGAALYLSLYFPGGMKVQLPEAFSALPYKLKYVMFPAILYFLVLSYQVSRLSVEKIQPSSTWQHLAICGFGLFAGLVTSPDFNWGARRASSFLDSLTAKLHLGGSKLENLKQRLLSHPNDTMALLEVARLESRQGSENAVRRYREAISGLWVRGKEREAMAAYRELFKAHGVGLVGSIQVHISRELIDRGEYDLAAESLRGAIDEAERFRHENEGEDAEMAYILLGYLYADKLDRPLSARSYFTKYLARFGQKSANLRRRLMIERKLDSLSHHNSETNAIYS